MRIFNSTVRYIFPLFHDCFLGKFFISWNTVIHTFGFFFFWIKLIYFSLCLGLCRTQSQVQENSLHSVKWNSVSWINDGSGSGIGGERVGMSCYSFISARSLMIPIFPSLLSQPYLLSIFMILPPKQCFPKLQLPGLLIFKLLPCSQWFKLQRSRTALNTWAFILKLSLLSIIYLCFFWEFSFLCLLMIKADVHFSIYK